MKLKKIKLYKKWWFWEIIIVICILIYTLTINYIKNKETKESLTNIANSATNFISGIEKAQSHLNEFSYNYETGQAEYKPSKITLEMYNKIKEGMKEEELSSILGKCDNKLQGEETYIMEWGNSYSPVYGGYWIQIVLDTNNTVMSKNQVGLK